MADAWNGSWGSAWGVSWGASSSSSSTTTDTGARQPGGFGGLPYREGRGARPADFKERRRIAAEMRALYRDVYEKLQNNEPAAEEAAALVAKYAPVNAPDVPPPNVIDWEMLTEEGRTVIVAFREALIQIQLMLAEQDDEEALLALLLAD